MKTKLEHYWDMQLWDSANNYLNKLEDTIRQIDDGRLTFRWSLQKEQQLNLNGQFDSAFFFIKKASSLLGGNRINYRDSIGYYRIFLHLLKEWKMFDSTLSVGNELYHLSLRNDSFQISIVSFELAEMYAAVNDLPNMRKYMLQAWKYKDEDPDNINSIARLFMYYYDRTDQVDSAMYYLNIKRSTPGLYGGQAASQAQLSENMGILLAKKGRLHEALQFQLKAKKYLDSAGIQYASFLNNLADTYVIMGQFGKAFKYVDSAITIAGSEKDYNVLKLASRTKSELYTKTSQHSKAYGALDSSYTYHEMEADSSLRKHARELETKYAVQAKDAEITALNVANQTGSKIRNQQRTIIVMLIIATLFIGATGVLLVWRRQIQMAIKEANLRQQLLRIQIDSHFLSNALVVLQSYINSNKEKTANYIARLYKLVRLSLVQSRSSFVTLSDELEVLESYLSIQQMYFDNAFEYRIAISADLTKERIKVPPMLLQPFAENSIIHGFKGIQRKGELTVAIERTKDKLCYMIEDNGRGFRSDDKSNRSMSTEINEERLEILSRQTGKKCGLRVIDKQKYFGVTGVKVIIEMPYFSD